MSCKIYQLIEVVLDYAVTDMLSYSYMGKYLAKDQRGRVAEKIMDLGNIAAGALLFGQTFSGSPFDFRLATLGLIVLALAYTWALALMRGGDR